MRITLGNTLPPYPDFVEGIRRAPDRGYTLTPAQTITALKNALRYIPSEWHEQLAPEFMEELRTHGRTTHSRADLRIPFPSCRRLESKAD